MRVDRPSDVVGVTTGGLESERIETGMCGKGLSRRFYGETGTVKERVFGACRRRDRRRGMVC